MEREETADYNIREKLADVWMKEYKGKSPALSRPHPREDEDTLDIFDQCLRASENDSVEVTRQEDEYRICCQTRPLSYQPESIIHWWAGQEGGCPSLVRWAYNIPSLPAMSAECECVFSSLGHLILLRRNRLGGTIAEDNECLCHYTTVFLFLTEPEHTLITIVKLWLYML